MLDVSGLQHAASPGAGLAGLCTIHLIVGQEQLHDQQQQKMKSLWSIPDHNDSRICLFDQSRCEAFGTQDAVQHSLLAVRRNLFLEVH